MKGPKMPKRTGEGDMEVGGWKGGEVGLLGRKKP